MNIENLENIINEEIEFNDILVDEFDETSTDISSNRLNEEFEVTYQAEMTVDMTDLIHEVKVLQLEVMFIFGFILVVYFVRGIFGGGRR